MTEVIELERSVLGAVMLGCGDLPPGVEVVSPTDFTASQHRAVWRAVLELARTRLPIDEITVAEALAGQPAPKIGWAAYLSELTDATPTAANLEYYARSLQARARRRDFIVATQRALERSKDESIDGDELMTGLVTELGRLAESRALIRPVSLCEAAVAEYHEIQIRGQAGGDTTGIQMGFDAVDALTGGMCPGDIIVIAGRPSMGKTAFANNIVRHVSIDGEWRALIFSLEMSCQSQAQRFISADGNIDLRRIRTGSLWRTDWDKLTGTMERLHNDRVHLVDRGGLSITEVRSITRQHAARKQVDLIVVDYMQLLRGTGDNREQQVADICRGLKALGMELHVPVIAISQLNRSVESRQDKRPMLSDLRESGSIEQDADVVIFLYRDDYYNPNSDEKGLCEVAIAKQRNGPTGMVKLRWIRECTRFAPLEDESTRPPETASEYAYETGAD